MAMPSCTEIHSRKGHKDVEHEGEPEETMAGEEASTGVVLFFQRCGSVIFLLTLCLYFIPMLAVIPHILFGGVQLDLAAYSEASYNSTLGHYAVDDAPTGAWYWDSTLAMFLVPMVPLVVLTSATYLKSVLNAPPRGHSKSPQLSV
uniref:Uncharacterized protein n=1 Tax=Noctiluca scintillans TaxID=2966 RepID=A0A7S1EWV2_NOCSC|mmetsp:Transcript_13708/g.37483  ORF Transcript_13708/g.37483 Transcript_13708/m.37483 type:complete len:146 (+) Transcript_13708:64-501(+)